MQGWFDSQRRDHGREFKFMNLDDIVQWIERERLINEFRAPLRELGIPIEMQ